MDEIPREDRLPTRPLRGFPRGESLIEVTTRTFQGRMLMKPTRAAREAILGVIGRALHKNPKIRLVGFWFLSNHYNLLVLTPDARALSRFVEHLNANIAREVGRQHGWTGRFWARRFAGIYVGPSEMTEEDRLQYLLAQGTKEGLVGSPHEWTGANCLRALMYGEKLVGRWHDRTREFNANRRLKPGSRERRKEFVIEYTIELAPLPSWAKLDVAERQKRVREMVRDIVRSAKKRRAGKKPYGMAKILAMSPHFRPKKVAETPAPLSHGSISERKWFRRFYRRLVDRFRFAASELAKGNAKALSLFPREGFLPPAPAGRRIRWKRFEFERADYRPPTDTATA